MKVIVNQKNIQENLNRIMDFFQNKKIHTMGIVKGICGNKNIVDLFLKAGFSHLGESRMSTLISLSNLYGDKAQLYLIRPPRITEIENVVKFANGSFHCNISTLKEIARQCSLQQRYHKVSLVVDIGHGREGFALEDLKSSIQFISDVSYLSLDRISCYLCQDEMVSSTENKLLNLKNILLDFDEKGLISFHALKVSAGSSYFFGRALRNHNLFSYINEFRIGTAALLGISSSIDPQHISFLNSDTFHLELEVMQVKKNLIILPVGLYDINPKDLIFREDLSIHSVFSDHLVLNKPSNFFVSDGDIINCKLNYYSLNRILMSPHVELKII